MRAGAARHDEAVTPTEPEEHGRGRDRALAFSDGVFAIAITLLVLSLRAPHLSGPHLDSQLRHALQKDGDVLLGFAISFFVIARFWLIHHRMSLLLRRVDGRFLVINLVFLASIVFLPFPTEVLGLYGGTTTAVVFYAATMVCVGGLSYALWRHAGDARLMAPMSEPERREAIERSVIPAVVFATSIPIAFATTTGAQLWWLLLLVSHRLRRTRAWRRFTHAPAAASGQDGAPRPPSDGPG